MKASHRRKALKSNIPSPRQIKALKKAELKFSQNALQLGLVIRELRDKLQYLALASSLPAENQEGHEELLRTIRNSPFDALSLLGTADLTDAIEVEKAIHNFLAPIELELRAATKEESAKQMAKAQPLML